MQPEQQNLPSTPQQNTPQTYSNQSSVAPPPANGVVSNFEVAPSDIKRKKKLPKWLKILLAILFVLLVMVAALVIVNESRFTTYDLPDNRGNQFTIKFYKDATFKPADEMPPFKEGDPLQVDTDFIVQPISENDYPLSVAIKKLEPGVSLLDSDELCGNDLLKLRNPAKGQTDIVCGLFSADKESPQPLYFYQVSFSGVNYLVYLARYYDYDYLNSITDPEKRQKVANDLLEKTDLRDFNEDLQIILPSINIQE